MPGRRRGARRHRSSPELRAGILLATDCQTSPMHDLPSEPRPAASRPRSFRAVFRLHRDAVATTLDRRWGVMVRGDVGERPDVCTPHAPSEAWHRVA
jgi:hypothetical protein